MSNVGGQQVADRLGELGRVFPSSVRSEESPDGRALVST